MRVLFVYSGNAQGGIGAVVARQAESLLKKGVALSFYPITGKGLAAYVRHVFLLRKYLKDNSFDIIHAHYSLSAFTATMAGCKPMVVSLMGSDAQAGKIVSSVIRFLNRNRWKHLVVKSASMKEQLKLGSTYIIPNGVDLTFFRPLDDLSLKSKYQFSESKKTILFLADPSRKSKNYNLAEQAIQLLNNDTLELQVRFNIPKEDVTQMLNAADIILLTSHWEGSPNVIKEAMACNRPIVATNVGDISWLFGEESGYFLTGFDPCDVANKMNKALEFVEKNAGTRGRERIVSLGLDAESIAKRIMGVYLSILEENGQQTGSNSN